MAPGEARAVDREAGVGVAEAAGEAVGAGFERSRSYSVEHPTRMQTQSKGESLGSPDLIGSEKRRRHEDRRLRCSMARIWLRWIECTNDAFTSR